MAQNGFAFFFLVVLVGCTVSLAAWLKLNWTTILVAVRGEVPKPRRMSYKAVQRRPIEVPYVAQRMLAQARPSAAAAGTLQPARARRARRQSGSQLAVSL